LNAFPTFKYSHIPFQHPKYPSNQHTTHEPPTIRKPVPTLNRIQQPQTTPNPRSRNEIPPSAIKIYNNFNHLFKKTQNAVQTISAAARSCDALLIARPVCSNQAIIHINDCTTQLGAAAELVQAGGEYHFISRRL
jgi:hypothetical protein